MARGEGFLGDVAFNVDEEGEEEARRENRSVRDRSTPGGVGTTVQAEDEAEDGGDQDDGTEEIHPGQFLPPVSLGRRVFGGGGVVRPREVQREPDGEEGQQTQRRLARKRPPPSQIVGKDTSQRCPRRRTGSVDDVDDALPQAAILQRDNITEQDRHDGRHAPTSNPLKRPRGDQLLDIPCRATEDTTQPKHDIGVQDASLSAEDVRQAAIERLERRQGEEVGARDPRCQIQRRQVAADASVARHDDGLVYGHEEDAHGDGGHNVPHLSRGIGTSLELRRAARRDG